jgi:hypothetical protein
MGDTLAWRMKFGVVTPSTNTVVPGCAACATSVAMAGARRMGSMT